MSCRFQEVWGGLFDGDEGLPPPHDARAVLKAWRKVAIREHLRWRVIEHRDGFPIVCVHSPGRNKERARPLLYFSAGIHGDEAAGVLGLLRWAIKHPAVFSACKVLIFPCLNPWGLTHNCRTDAAGRDLNRMFGVPGGPSAGIERFLERWRFDAALCLHEDYDGRGVYLYEIARASAPVGEHLLDAVERVLPREPRARIEGRKFERGLCWRRAADRSLPNGPEAVYLARGKSERVFTFETPSEADLSLRVKAQEVFLDAVVELVCGH